MRLSHQVQDLSENYLISCFISGLRDSVKYELIAKRPRTMVEAMRLEKVEEEKTTAIRKSQRSSYLRNQPQHYKSGGGSGHVGTVAIGVKGIPPTPARE